MPKRKRSSTPNYESYEEDFVDDESLSSTNSNLPVQRSAANARERARMRVLSSAFSRLKTKLPNIPPDTKLSKLDTLRLATFYIQQLTIILDGEPGNDDAIKSGMNLTNAKNVTWPFTFQQINNGVHNLYHNHSSSSDEQRSRSRHYRTTHYNETNDHWLSQEPRTSNKFFIDNQIQNPY